MITHAMRLALALGLLGFAQAASAADQTWPKIDIGDWEVLDEGDDARFFRMPAPAGRHPRAWLRQEYRAPQELEGGAFLSTTTLTEFDCARKARRHLSMSVFARNNMKGERFDDRPGPEWEAVRPNSITQASFDIACVDFVAAPPPAWPVMHDGVWQRIDDEDDVKTYYNFQVPLIYPRAWIRYEFREPGAWNNRPYKSGQALNEFDCEGGRVRAVLTVQYPENNLQGAPDMAGQYSDWMPIKLGSTASYASDMACAADLPAAADEAEGRVTSWQSAAADRRFRFVDQGSWATYSLSDDSKGLIKGSNGGLYPRVELRKEYTKAQTVDDVTYKSMWSLLEVDCTAGRQRIVEGAAYGANNLKGKKTAFAGTTDWSPMTQEEGETLLMAMCNLGVDHGEDPINPEGVVAAPARSAE